MIWMDVDTALASVPVNAMPLISSTDFVTIQDAVVYNQAGLALFWSFTTTAGVTTVTAITPTTSGDYDWTDFTTSGMYGIEIPASGGASINNDTEGFGHFTGVATGILPWAGPIIGFRAAALNNSLVDGTTIDVNVTAINGGATTGNNATLSLKSLNIQNNAGNAILAASTAADTSGIKATGTGNGHGLQLQGGTAGAGLYAEGGTAGDGIAAQGHGVGSGIAAAGGVTDGPGFYAAAGGSGPGAQFDGGSTAGFGMHIKATAGNSVGLYVSGFGSGEGAKLEGGATGRGGVITGGATSGKGLVVVSPNGDGDIDAPDNNLLVQADVRAAVGLASANLDTQLADLGIQLEGLVLEAQEPVGSTGNDTTHVHLAGLTAPDGEYVGQLLLLSSLANGYDVVRAILAWDQSSELATVATLPFTPVPTDDTWWLIVPQAGTVTGTVDANVVSISGDSGAADNLETALDGGVFNVGGGGVIAASVTGNVGGNVTGSVGSVAAGGITSASIATGAVDADALATDAVNEIADGLLGRNVAGGSSTGRIVSEALYFLRNKWTVAAGTLTVYATDDATPSWTATVSSDAAADPIVGNDPS